MLDPAIWSKLPTELLFCICEHASISDQDVTMQTFDMSLVHDLDHEALLKMIGKCAMGFSDSTESIVERLGILCKNVTREMEVLRAFSMTSKAFFRQGNRIFLSRNRFLFRDLPSFERFHERFGEAQTAQIQHLALLGRQFKKFFFAGWVGRLSQSYRSIKIVDTEFYAPRKPAGWSPGGKHSVVATTASRLWRLPGNGRYITALRWLEIPCRICQQCNVYKLALVEQDKLTLTLVGKDMKGETCPGYPQDKWTGA